MTRHPEIEVLHRAACPLQSGDARTAGNVLWTFSSSRSRMNVPTPPGRGCTQGAVAEGPSRHTAARLNDPTDGYLLQRIVERDAAALAALYDRHNRLLFGLTLRILRDRSEAEEILQEAFVRVWTRAQTYDSRRGGALPWIVRLARNCAIDRLRARRSRVVIDAPVRDGHEAEAVPAADTESPESAVLDAERREALTDALAGLAADQRQLIEAAFFEGYTHSELARRFGLPLGTVKTRIRTGMTTMRRRLEHTV